MKQFCILLGSLVNTTFSIFLQGVQRVFFCSFICFLIKTLYQIVAYVYFDLIAVIIETWQGLFSKIHTLLIFSVQKSNKAIKRILKRLQYLTPCKVICFKMEINYKEVDLLSCPAKTILIVAKCTFFLFFIQNLD